MTPTILNDRDVKRKRKIGYAERKFVRSVAGYTRKYQISNAEIREEHAAVDRVSVEMKAMPVLTAILMALMPDLMYKY
jgi:hypothetical protein